MKEGVKQVGFTLVELLIVIALIGILAAALVATLNPIEQVNKARDSRFKNDAAELLAALERYYASTQTYPWVDGDTITVESEYGAMAGDVSVGVVNNGDQQGVLISSGELKPAFANKEQFTTTNAIDALYVYKGEGSGGSVYVCFIPKAGTNRGLPTLKDVCDTGNANGCTVFVEPTETCTPATGPNVWDSAGTACFMCVPE